MSLKPLIGNCISVAVPVLNGEGINRDAVMGDLAKQKVLIRRVEGVPSPVE